MGSNFKKLTILYRGKYYDIDKKPEFHQAACKHKFIKAQITKTADDLLSELLEGRTKKGTFKEAQIALKLARDLGLNRRPIGKLPKAVNLCKKCGKVKIRNN